MRVSPFGSIAKKKGDRVAILLLAFSYSRPSFYIFLPILPWRNLSGIARTALKCHSGPLSLITNFLVFLRSPFFMKKVGVVLLAIAVDAVAFCSKLIVLVLAINTHTVVFDILNTWELRKLINAFAQKAPFMTAVCRRSTLA